MKQIKACAVALTIQATLLVGGNHLYAAAQLSLSDGSTTVIVVDGGPGDANVEAGVITFIGAVGPNWFFNATAGVTKPALGSPASPYMDVGTTSLSLQAGQLTIEFTDTDFTASGTGTASVGATVPPGGTISYNVWLDAGNNPFAKTTPLTTIGPIGGAPSGTATADVGVGPYSLTLQTIINHAGAGQTHVDAEFRVIPSRSCDCELTLTPPADLSLCGEANLPDGNQVAAGLTVTDSCGVIAQVQFLGDEIVSGSCPKIIKRTFAAIDSCRNLRTAIQTITVTNTAAPVFTQCPPDLNLGCNPASIPDCDLTQVAATNNCGTAATIICDQVDVQDGCSFTRTITYTATNDCGNSATCVQKITWKQDTTAPVFTKCPAGGDLGCNPASIPTCDLTQVAATDEGCGLAAITCASEDTTNGCKRTRRITYTATDGCGNTATCVQIFTWTEDTTKPTVTCPPGGSLGANPATLPTCETVAAQVVANDNCHVKQVYCEKVDSHNGCDYSRTFTFRAEDDCGNFSEPCSVTFTWTTEITVQCPANSGQVGVPYNSAVTASGGVPPYTFAIVGGALPTGLTLDPNTGAITGTPTEADHFAFTIEVTDAAGCKARVTCRMDIIGVGGCRVTGGSNHQLNSWQSACITTELPTHISHGGQVGAPYSVESPFTPNSPCIWGEWQHNRHLKGNSLVGTFHASGNGGKHEFDSLLCACLPCEENPNAVGVIGGVCNPGDRICGPEPRRAPANKICFSGVGDYTFTNGKKTVKAVFRVDIEDRSEGNSHASAAPPDRYRIRIWLLDPSCGRNPDPNSPEAMAIRFAASADPATIGTLATTEQLKVNIPPDIDDGGDMTQGNHQIHPATGATCGALAIPAAATQIDVASEIAYLTSTGPGTFGLFAQGYQGSQNPAFVYRTTVNNPGTTTLGNLSVIQSTDTNVTDVTSQFFAAGATLAPGASITRYHTNTCGADTIKTFKVSGTAIQSGAPVSAASATMAMVGDPASAPKPAFGALLGQTVVAAWGSGIVKFALPAATSEFDPNVKVTSSPASGTVLGPGQRTVNVTATDMFGNSVTASFTLTVLAPLRVAFQSPLNDGNKPGDATPGSDNVANKFSVGQTIYNKVKLYDTTGKDVTSTAAVTVKIDVVEMDNMNPVWGLDIPEDYAGTGDAGGRMVLSSGMYQYNLKSNGFEKGTANNGRFFVTHVQVYYNSAPGVIVGDEDAQLESK